MAVSTTPQYRINYPLNGLPPEHFLVLAIEAASRLNWRIHYFSINGLVAVSATATEQIRFRIEAGTASITSIGGWLYDAGTNRKNVEQFIAKLSGLRQQIPADYLAHQFVQLSPMLTSPEVDATIQSLPVKGTQSAGLLAVFKPAKDYYITPIILNLNLLVFLLMGLCGVSILEPDSASLLAWGANFGPLTKDAGQWWRLLTSCFLHIGAIHLLMNMYAFLLIGAQLEPRLGRLRFLIAYIVAGLAASGTSLWWHGQTISAGASGAIFGMYGVFLSLLMTGCVQGANRKQLFASILFFIVYNLLGGLKEGIDNAAHIGGLITGLIIGYGYSPLLAKPETVVAVPELPVEEEDYYQGLS